MVTTNAEQLRQLYQMAHKYDIPALMTACRLSITQNLQSSELVPCAILGHLCKDDELKSAALSQMGKEAGPLNRLKDAAMLEKYPALLLEIAEQMKYH